MPKRNSYLNVTSLWVHGFEHIIACSFVLYKSSWFHNVPQWLGCLSICPIFMLISAKQQTHEVFGDLLSSLHQRGETVTVSYTGQLWDSQVHCRSGMFTLLVDFSSSDQRRNFILDGLKTTLLDRVKSFLKWRSSYLTLEYTAMRTIAGAIVYTITDVANVVWSTTHVDHAPPRCAVTKSQGSKT